MIFRVTQGTLEILAVGGGSPGILSLRTAEPWRKNLGLGSDGSGFESCQCDLEQVSRLFWTLEPLRIVTLEWSVRYLKRLAQELDIIRHLVAVSVHSGCYNNALAALNISFTPFWRLGSSRLDLVSGEDLLPWFIDSCLATAHDQRNKGALWGLFLKGYQPHAGLPS